ncbi:hypothetical protein [Aporhodopirellula aestuarii]|nr:hypothetical protein [Aporhodopirellula aestuarii]
MSSLRLCALNPMFDDARHVDGASNEKAQSVLVTPLSLRRGLLA